MHLAKTRWQAKSQVTLRMLLQANSRVMRRALFQANSPAKHPRQWRAKTAGWKPLLLEALLQATEILRAQGPARQCLRGLDPFAFFREIPVAQKCNRAACCGECPIFSRYRRRCSRRELVEYGNRRSRLLRKRAPPV
jgi:hypothetical protein